MSSPLLPIFTDSCSPLQHQIREQLVVAILDGYIPVDMPLPSTRRLARQLRVSRNTVVTVYETLAADGYLISRERSGFYVNPEMVAGNIATDHEEADQGTAIDWLSRLKVDPVVQSNVQKSYNWQEFEYPFIYGQLDPTLFPVNNWRECNRDAVSVQAIRDWTSDRFDSDDPLLVEQIRTRILTRRGIRAKDDEILITIGSQQALYLLAQLLLDSESTLGIENPGYMNVANIARLFRARVLGLPLDEQGVVLGDRLKEVDCLYVTPSHQCPTTVTMPLNRRSSLLQMADKHDFTIIEDDYECEINFQSDPTPALKSLDKSGRVIYLGSLSKTLAPGLRLGFLVGPATLIERARTLRQLMLRHPPSNNQRSVALFLSRGYHDSLVRSLTQAYAERGEIMANALSRYLPKSTLQPWGGSSFWVKGPKGLDARELKREAISRGILIESGDVYFLPEEAPLNFFKLGYSSIPAEKIEPGIRKLAELIHQLTGEQGSEVARENSPPESGG